MKEIDPSDPQGPQAPQDGEPDAEHGEDWPLAENSIGAFLKSEREKKGLSYARVAQMTRVRPYILEAIEKEDWDHLPSPVFVKGFLRSYAGALGLDEGKVAALYLYPDDGSLETARFKTLETPVRSRKGLYGLIILLLIALAGGYFFLREYPVQKKASTVLDTSSRTIEKLASPEGPKKVTVQIEPPPPKQQEPRSTEAEGTATVAVESSSAEKTSGAETGSTVVQTEPEETTATGPDDLETAGNSTQTEQENTVPPAEEQPVSGPETATEGESVGVTLKADVLKRTWIRVFVDDLEPKEYILRPGNRPEWTAKKKLELLIGNAGGVALEFNGEKIGKLGDIGQVVRVKLPEDYDRKRFQD